MRKLTLLQYLFNGSEYMLETLRKTHRDMFKDVCTLLFEPIQTAEKSCGLGKRRPRRQLHFAPRAEKLESSQSINSQDVVVRSYLCDYDSLFMR